MAWWPGEKRSDSAVELGAQGSPSSLLARVRKRQRTEDCVCVGRQGRPAAAQLHELVVQEHALGRRKPLPSILSQFSEHGLLEPGGCSGGSGRRRATLRTWYHGLGEVQGILALKEALQRGGQEVGLRLCSNGHRSRCWGRCRSLQGRSGANWCCRMT